MICRKTGTVVKKVCTKCGDELTPDKFNSKGFVCKICTNQYMMNYYNNNEHYRKTKLQQMDKYNKNLRSNNEKSNT